jgi:hypothetical protein
MKVYHSKRTPEGVSTRQPWDKADLFFLCHAVRHGMAAEEVAGFLRRSVDEVRVKARQLDKQLICEDISIQPRASESSGKRRR